MAIRAEPESCRPPWSVFVMDENSAVKAPESTKV